MVKITGNSDPIYKKANPTVDSDTFFYAARVVTHIFEATTDLIGR